MSKTELKKKILTHTLIVKAPPSSGVFCFWEYSYYFLNLIPNRQPDKDGGRVIDIRWTHIVE
jgi:hypothetical protein